MTDFSKLYIARKSGREMSWSFRAAAVAPLLIIFLISAVLSFSIVFVSSVSSQIDRMMQVLGSGTIAASAMPEEIDGEISLTSQTEGLIYSASESCAAVVKGVEEGYFDGMRGSELDIMWLDGNPLNPAVASSSLATRLGLSLGDRMTILVMEGHRARPVLLTLSGIFDSVYPQLDEHLIFIPLQFVDGKNTWEILLSPDADADSVLGKICSDGIYARSYKELYPSMYRNIRSSVSIMYLVLSAVAVLAAFFSSDAAESYTSRDRRDIKILSMLGIGKKELTSIYLRITMIGVGFSSLIGTAAGLLISLLSPSIIEAVARDNADLLSYYVRSFSLNIPWGVLLLMLFLMISVSALSVIHFLSRTSCNG